MTLEQLNNSELERYSRQIMLDEIGYKGQLKLKNGKACIIGVGGLGVPISVRLALMGVGHIRIVDRDIVSLSDLHRQYLYDERMIGRAKVEVASEKIEKMNPDITIEPIAESVASYNVKGIIAGCDVVLDGLDRIETRYLVNNACVEEQIPYVYGGAIRNIGNVTTIIPKITPCLECFNPGLKDEWTEKCSIVGVFPPLLDVVAAIQVSEATRIIAGKQPKLAGKLLFIDLENIDFNTVEINRSEQCSICGKVPDPILPKDRRIEEECARKGKRTFVLTPKKPLELDLNQINHEIRVAGLKVECDGRLYTTFRYHKGIVSIMKSGVIILQTEDKDTKSELITDISRLVIGWATGIPQNAYS